MDEEVKETNQTGTGTDSGTGSDTSTETTTEEKKSAFEEFLDKIFSGKKEKEEENTATAETEKEQTASDAKEQIEKAVAEAKEKWLAEQEEEKRLAKLSPEEQEKARATKTETELEQLRAEMLARDLKDNAMATLETEGYPTQLASLLTYTSKEDMEQSLSTVKDTFKNCLETAIKERLRGRTPEGLGGAGNMGYHTGDEMIKSQIAKNIRGGF